LVGGSAIFKGLACADEVRSDSSAVPPPLSTPIWIGTKQTLPSAIRDFDGAEPPVQAPVPIDD
jgi:hypothetical protein